MAKKTQDTIDPTVRDKAELLAEAKSHKSYDAAAAAVWEEYKWGRLYEDDYNYCMKELKSWKPSEVPE